MDSSNVARIVGSDMTVSDKIRALDKAGYPRAEIARVLGKRYQHIRNVLEADKLHRVRPAAQANRAEPEAGLEEAPRAFGGRRQSNIAVEGLERTSDHDVEDRGDGAFRLVLRDDGSVMLPQSVRAAFGLSPGKALMARLDGDEFKLFNAATAMRRIQEMLRPYMKDGESWADSLIADRRREAAREESDG
jgi:bifunctional DNA-binding transcriptional regulator/antitoxin component of YhaV-PrlF toxin-antitoxin module